MQGGSSGTSGPDLEYIASLLDRHDQQHRGGPSIPDENATPSNLVLTPTSWKQDHWLKPPPDLSSNFKSDPIDSEYSLSKLSTDFVASKCDLIGERPWRLSHQLTSGPTEPPPSLERRHAGQSPDQQLLQENIVLQRRIHELELELQSAQSIKTELQQALNTAKTREQSAQDDLTKCNETIREQRRINQSLVEERALLEAKTSSQLRKDERIRSRLESEIVRQKNLVRDATEETARLRSALQEAANETELCIQREKENWASAEALRNEQLIQRLKQEASQTVGLRPADASIRDRDIQIAQLNIHIAEQQRLLEQQQKDNERLAEQATRLQELLDQYRSKTERSPETSLLLELKEIQTQTQTDLTQSTQAVQDERILLSNEFNQVKQQLKQIAEHFVSVKHELQQNNEKQANIQQQMADLESRFRLMETDVKNKPSMVESIDNGPRSSISNEITARQQLAHHLQRAAELGVDLPPHMPQLSQPGQKQSTTGRKSIEPIRTSICSSSSSKTKPIRKPAAPKKSAKRSQTRSPARSRLYPAPSSWR